MDQNLLFSIVRLAAMATDTRVLTWLRLVWAAILLPGLTACGGSTENTYESGSNQAQRAAQSGQQPAVNRSDPGVVLVTHAVEPPPDGSDPIRLSEGAVIGITVAVDPRVARQLSLNVNNYRVLGYPVSDAVDEWRERRERATFTILLGPVENDGRNVLVTLSLRSNGAGEPYRLTLEAVQGPRRWSRSLVRGRGAERPGHERISSGEEGPWMTLNQRLETSLRPDTRDLAERLVRHISWEAAGDQREDALMARAPAVRVLSFLDVPATSLKSK